MIKLIRANQKKFLAGLTIFSMVGFVVQRGNGTRDGNTDRKVATVNGKAITGSEFAQARAEISAVRSSLDLSYYRQGSLGYLLGHISQPAELFALLRREANDAGVQANSDEVNTIMTNLKVPGADPDNDDAARAGLVDLLKIETNYLRIASAIKLSQPAVEKQLAEQSQSLAVKLVQVRADHFLDKIQAPTTQQAQDQFNKFSDNLPNHPDPASNPFGFGYKIPDRASYDWLRLSDDAVTVAVVASKSAFDWSVQAKKYYYNNKELYRQPATTAPSTQPSPQPAYQSEEQVDAQILTLLRKDLISDLRQKIETYIATTMDADWAAYSQFIAGGSRGTEPDSSLGVPYTSDKYPLKMFDSVKSKFNVNLSAGKSPGFQIQAQFHSFGSAATEQFIAGRMAQYIAKSAASDPQAIALMCKPSDPLPDVLPSATLFVRLTGVLKAAPPPDMSMNRGAVEIDWKLAKAYDLAKEQANALLLAAKSDTLDVVAKAMGQTVIQPDPKSPIMLSSNIIAGVDPALNDLAGVFTAKVFKLIDNYDPSVSAHPAAIIELPPQGRVFVAQLQGIETKWNTEEYLTDFYKAQSEVRQDIFGPAAGLWFNIDKVKARLNYQPLKGN